MPLFFCPLDSLTESAPTTMAAEHAAIGPDGRDRHGLCVDAMDAPEATETATAYLLDCIRSGSPGLIRATEVVIHGDVPTVYRAATSPPPNNAERRTLAAIINRARAMRGAPRDGFTDTPAAPDGSIPPDYAGSMPR